MHFQGKCVIFAGVGSDWSGLFEIWLLREVQVVYRYCPQGLAFKTIRPTGRKREALRCFCCSKHSEQNIGLSCCMGNLGLHTSSDRQKQKSIIQTPNSFPGDCIKTKNASGVDIVLYWTKRWICLTYD